jgi:hypothetical protein
LWICSSCRFVYDDVLFVKHEELRLSRRSAFTDGLIRR